MRTLASLQSTSAGRDILEQAMTFDDPDRFLGHLRSPVRGDSGCDRPARSLPVYAHQQVYFDYRASVVAKIRSLRELAHRSPDVAPAFVWIDTDRAGSDKLSLRLYLRTASGRVAVRPAPAGCEHQEPRFIAMDPVRVQAAIDRIGQIVRGRGGGSPACLARLDRLRPLLNAGGTVSDVSRALTDGLLDETMAFRPAPVLVSHLIASGALHPVLDAILNRQAEVVAVFNAQVRALQALDIEPQVKPVPDDYLPLFMTCPRDGRRLRLRLVRDGGLHLACAVDAAGTAYRYELGRGVLAMQALDAGVRWSPDVMLPVLLNDRFSGMVAGKSSALYMLVFRAVMRQVLDMTPVPVLVPSDWDVFPGAFDSLFDAYLDGRRV
jgi:hypothetical protein